jgi:hypothetical protein
MKKPLTVTEMARAGGKARAASLTPEQRKAAASKAGAGNRKLTPEQRKERASKAARARWAGRD